MEAFLGLAVFAIIAVGIIALFNRSKRSSPKIDPGWQPPKSDPLPYFKKNYFFSAAERSFYEVLKRLVPEHTVFAKVRLLDLVYVGQSKESRQSHLNRVQSKHIDFLICDAMLTPVVAIELDDCSHTRQNRLSRDEFVNQVFATAQLPLLRIPVRRSYAPNDLRNLLSLHLRIATPTS